MQFKRILNISIHSLLAKSATYISSYLSLYLFSLFRLSPRPFPFFSKNRYCYLGPLRTCAVGSDCSISIKFSQSLHYIETKSDSPQRSINIENLSGTKGYQVPNVKFCFYQTFETTQRIILSLKE